MLFTNKVISQNQPYLFLGGVQEDIQEENHGIFYKYVLVLIICDVEFNIKIS